MLVMEITCLDNGNSHKVDYSKASARGKLSDVFMMVCSFSDVSHRHLQGGDRHRVHGQGRAILIPCGHTID